MPEFKNIENKSVIADGQQYWISRSIAVVAIPVFRLPDYSLHIPTGIRSQKTPDYQGKLGLVCGYLDWNESAFEAVKRECWEEIGLDLGQYFDPTHDPQPYFVQSEPKQDDRQNVTLRYRFLIDCDRLPEIFRSTEVSGEIWVSEVNMADYQFAFNHAELIDNAFADYPDRTDLRFSANSPPWVY